MPRPAPIDRLASKIRVDANGCWRFTGAIQPNGYGYFFFEGRMRYAHRVAYQLHVGPIPAGHDLDHLCRVRDCCNPAHLEPVTRRENLRRVAGLGGVLRAKEAA